jgi:hypothetical protein
MDARPADRYDVPGDLWVVTCYFNVNRYRTRRLNYERFAAPIRRSGLGFLTIECAFPGAPFALPPGPGLLRLAGRDVMWQKERLLNVAIAALPAACTKVAWLDCDVLFADPAWAVETSRRLERQAVVQPYERVVRLPRGAEAYRGEGDVWDGFAAVAARDPDALLSGRFDRHGHTGFAWAARREIIARHGLYDACIAGSGDHMMAHAFCGDWESSCIDRIIGPADNHHAGHRAGHRTGHRTWFEAWSRRVYPDVRARVGYAPGTILHLWHGEVADRRYVDRNRELARFDFDPATDLRVGPTGGWEWASEKPELHRWAVEYFGHRREDGGPDGAASHEEALHESP